MKKAKPDPRFTDTNTINVGDTIGFDPSKEGTGGYEEGVVEKKYLYSLVLEGGRSVGIARVVERRPPGAKHYTLPGPRSPKPPAPPKREVEKPLIDPSDKYISYPF